MAKKPSKHPKPSPHAAPSADSAKSGLSADKQRRVHDRAVPAAVYRTVIASVLGEQLDGLADPAVHARAVIEGMAPRDSAEEMLVAQLLFTHARVMRLTALAGIQKDIEAVRIVNEYADRASNTYRRLMLALSEYRRPPRAGDTFAVVKQANIAGQQVIQNNEHSTKRSTNEQGCVSGWGGAGSSAAGQPTISVDAVGVGFSALHRTAGQTLDSLYRPADGSREGAIADERDEAR